MAADVLADRRRAAAQRGAGAARAPALSPRLRGGSVPCGSSALGRLGREQVLKREAVARHDLSQLDLDRSVEDRAGVDEGVELAVLAAGVDAGGQVGQQRLVKAAADEGGVELPGVDADECRLETGVDEIFGEDGGVAAPEGEEAGATGAGQSLLAIGADVGEEEVAEGNRGDSIERRSGERA